MKNGYFFHSTLKLTAQKNILQSNKTTRLRHDLDKTKKFDELIIANEELAFQNEEKEKQSKELSISIKELQAFTYVSSHDNEIRQENSY